jgi:pimeloyl-ACP methyl ester carboxylesterase
MPPLRLLKKDFQIAINQFRGGSSMKGTVGSIGCKTLETMVGLEENLVHPMINAAANVTRFMGAYPLEAANFFLDMTKYTIAVPQLFLGIGNPLFVNAVNMVNPKRQLDYLHHATQHIEPMRPSLPHHIEWEDERAALLTCDVENGTLDNPVTIFVAYTGRSAALADYNSRFNPYQRSSLAREFLDNGFGPVNIFAAKNPQEENLDQATPEYLKSVHEANRHTIRTTGRPPHIVGLCQMGYFNAWNLADNPDDANTFVLAGAPFDPRQGDNWIKQFADSISIEEVDEYLKASGNRMSASLMAKGWRLMDEPDYFIGRPEHGFIARRHVKLFYQMADDGFDCERDYVFKSWMDKDVVSDIAGGLYRDLFSFFKYGLEAECIRDKDFSRITCPTAVMSGGKDDISPVETCTAIFSKISSNVTRAFHNPLVGHTGIYNSEKALTGRYHEDNWQQIMKWMHENSIHNRRRLN